MTFDPSHDYLKFDFLKTVLYFSSTADDDWHAGVDINNCSFAADVHTVAPIGEADLRRTQASLIIRMPEWPDSGVELAPQRGDYFTYLSKNYRVELVDEDLDRLKQWILTCYSTDAIT